MHSGSGSEPDHRRVPGEVGGRLVSTSVEARSQRSGTQKKPVFRMAPFGTGCNAMVECTVSVRVLTHTSNSGPFMKDRKTPSGVNMGCDPNDGLPPGAKGILPVTAFVTRLTICTGPPVSGMK